MGNYKKGRIWSNFSTPAIIAAFYFSLQFVIEFPVTTLLYMSQLTIDIVTSKLSVEFISQIICILIFFFIIIPFLKVKDVEFNSISYTSLRKGFFVFCLYWAILIPTTLIFSAISNILNTEIDIFTNTLPLPKDQRENLFFIIIWLITGTLGIATFLEYIYRRTVIPLLEKRGMSPLYAVLTSSCAFAIINIPFSLGLQITFLSESNLLNLYLSKYDLINSFFYSLNLFIIPFLLGIACGIIYILTRNIVFSILIHCFAILPYYAMELFTNNIILISFLGVLIIVVNIIGDFIAIYTLYSVFFRSNQLKWTTILKKRSSIDITRGLIGFFLSFLGIIIYLVVFLGLLAEHAPILVTLLFHIIFLGFCFRNLKRDALRRQTNSAHYELKGDINLN